MQKQLSPGMLPIARYESEIVELIDRAPVVVISGKTGCGKSTQVPQYILRKHPEAKIIICQPRRVAATSLAVRVSQELKCKLGTRVGYHIGMQSFREQNCSIVYMTYGILIQQLLFMQSIPYTHIVLDEIHERSLDMDFTFVALKKIINGKYRQRIKLVVMSATLNADLFCDYFCTDSEGSFYLSELKETRVARQTSRRGRGRGQEEGSIESFEIVPPGSQFKPALRLELQEEKLFKVEEYYLYDFKQKEFYYGEEEQRISEQMYTFAIDLIKTQRKSKLQGDILIFLPGLFEITTLKNLLIAQEFTPNQIIEVHSLFSDELYHKLFDSSIRNKLILATNIGESSITLPFCRVVIDFCLSRKSCSKDRGVTRLETRLASQANLIQRSGRVGRVSDGIVYRLVTKQLYEKLSQYQKPEIQCVSLEMVILRVKQLDLINKNDILKNPCYFLMATISPPDIQDIKRALEILIHEEALMGETEQASSIRNADQLFLSDIGKFMVEMPCELRISKMILMGLKIRQPLKIISIACVLMLTKQFFLHEERRYNIEEFMHSLIGYDRGYYNDYMLRENLFSHWREEFYEKAKEKRLFKRRKFDSSGESPARTEAFTRIYETEEGAEEVLTFLEEFNQEKWSEKEREWCSMRGVSPNTMRELIRMEENLRLKIISKNFKLSEKEYSSNELVLLCLEYGFPENDCDIRWTDISQQLQINSEASLYYIELPSREETKDDYLLEYIRPEKNFRIEETNNGKTKRIFGNPATLCKFILPKHYSKGEAKYTSPLYQHLARNNSNHRFGSEIHLRCRPITVLNESICKACVPFDAKRRYKLITHKFTEIGTKKLIGMGALVEEETFFMIQLILKKNVELTLHPSGEYFCGYKANDISYKMATPLDEQTVKDILYYRDLISQKKWTKLSKPEEMMSAEDVAYLVKLLRTEGGSCEREIWEYRYEIELHGHYEEQHFPILSLPPLKQKTNYRERYSTWKLKMYEDFYRCFRPLLMENIFLICRKCSKNQIVELDQLSFFSHQTAILKLNQYSGSWKVLEGEKLCCKYGHQVGKVLNEEEAKINREAVQLYIPFNIIEDLWPSSEWRSEEEQGEMIARGKQELQRRKSELDHAECIFCFDYLPATGEPVFKRFQRDQLRQNYFKKYMDHMRNHQHLNNVVKYRSSLNLGL